MKCSRICRRDPWGLDSSEVDRDPEATNRLVLMAINRVVPVERFVRVKVEIVRRVINRVVQVERFVRVKVEIVRRVINRVVPVERFVRVKVEIVRRVINRVVPVERFVLVKVEISLVAKLSRSNRSRRNANSFVI